MLSLQNKRLYRQNGISFFEPRFYSTFSHSEFRKLYDFSIYLSVTIRAMFHFLSYFFWSIGLTECVEVKNGFVRYLHRVLLFEIWAWTMELKCIGRSPTLFLFLPTDWLVILHLELLGIPWNCREGIGSMWAVCGCTIIVNGRR